MEKRCQIVRTLDVVGEKWSLLIVRNALRGQTRFSEFRESLGVPTDVLTSRLATLVEGGILEKRAYREPGSRERSSYHLTSAGEGLGLVFAAMIQWGDDFNPAPTGPVYRVVDPAGGDALRLTYVDERGDTRESASVVRDSDMAR
ncbi:transcriptional regulator [Glaciihabitans arcticus]|uniref:Transcriptional regulator n=1 Tax=Glaciihabitans arcticus TaxID=2668039 RepID=A0A4V6MTP2_9MICO|nr:helix-turn-helix domain-containing protein [Glaciihabitans arcticus]TBN58049.1 transcriptional regulator [Glaciihabitans arcticus]